MYKIPETFNTEVLINQTISIISYTSNHIRISWDYGYLQIMGTFSILYNNNLYSFDEIYPISNDHHLLVLLDKKITDVEIPLTRDSLTIHFENNSILTLYSQEQYESFEISYLDNRIII